MTGYILVTNYVVMYPKEFHNGQKYKLDETENKGHRSY